MRFLQRPERWIPRASSSRLLALAAIMAAMAGCAAKVPEALAKIPGLAGATEVYTLTNLHPDDPRTVLYAANYQRAGLLPVCTRVQIERLGGDVMEFRVESSGKVYEYAHHKSAIEPFPQHLSRYFGPRCPDEAMAKLGEIDRRNIRSGTVEAGMTRQGVLFAIGYPPTRTTPDLQATKWRYWRNRFRSFHVEFDDRGRVAKVGWKR
jgi:hypothetical protein